MHDTAEVFRDRTAEQYGLDVDVSEFPEGTKTAEDAARAVGCELGQIVKSIVMTVGDDVVVVLTSGENRGDSSKLAAHFGVSGERVDTADPEAVKRTTGWSVGGVPPFCHDEPVAVLMDESLHEYERVWAAAGTPSAVFDVRPDTMEELAGAETVGVFE